MSETPLSLTVSFNLQSLKLSERIDQNGMHIHPFPNPTSPSLLVIKGGGTQCIIFSCGHLFFPRTRNKGKHWRTQKEFFPQSCIEECRFIPPPLSEIKQFLDINDAQLKSIPVFQGYFPTNQTKRIKLCIGCRSVGASFTNSVSSYKSINECNHSVGVYQVLKKGDLLYDGHPLFQMPQTSNQPLSSSSIPPPSSSNSNSNENGNNDVVMEDINEGTPETPQSNSSISFYQ
jgi:hypothetical protein